MGTPPTADHPFAGASVLICGASGGIGSALALEMHGRGATLTLSGRDVARLAEVPVPGARIVRDLRTSGACEDAVRGAVDHAGTLDILVNAVGVVAFGPVAELSATAAEQLLQTNAMVPMMLACEARSPGHGRLRRVQGGRARLCRSAREGGATSKGPRDRRPAVAHRHGPRKASGRGHCAEPPGSPRSAARGRDDLRCARIRCPGPPQRRVCDGGVLTDDAIVGAGLAGLTCAQDLTRAGLECTVLEASDGVGGRVRTDAVDGFLLDLGFQILLSAYPQVKRRLDLRALGLGRFEPGALVRTSGGVYRLSDPLRRPLKLVAGLRSPIGSLADKARAARLVIDVRIHPVRELLRRPDMSTAERLSSAGLSDEFITAFWRPLFAGIQLDPDLEVSSRRFDTILRTIATGYTGLPRDGMGAVPAQIASTLPEGAVRLGSRVESVEPGAVLLSKGERIAARAVVIATDGPAAHRLLGRRIEDPGSRAAACSWFSAPFAPAGGATLMLEGAGLGPALNVVVMSEVQPSYAPAGRALVAAAVPGPEPLERGLTDRVREQLAGWFGSSTSDWSHLRTDVIPHGQPLQRPPLRAREPVDLGDGVYVCGDHRDTASIQGAMFSGERTAAAVLGRLHGVP